LNRAGLVVDGDVVDREGALFEEAVDAASDRLEQSLDVSVRGRRQVHEPQAIVVVDE